MSMLSVQDQLRAFGADICWFVTTVRFSQADTLRATRLGGVNLHGSLLPRHRGAAPVQWAILSGDTANGCKRHSYDTKA